ncbi:TPA: Trifolitoxin immunity domain protein [Bacillus pacificus]|nr:MULTISPECIES: Trifolitoxin immunity domain protein [Bacillus cereus group]MCC2388978.1 Trifolitoxin immunity domain protein [Bacillus pacificus]MCC2473451.1 Trifolitoxin immunity domain protein [Bacillus pacificus]MDA2141698.1 Trifolitoxin immunity domain protein [Bacillus cereus group sp. Bc256]MDA2770864.1 Trifolitoxin immunity domain protein [Bacillus cereus group sp. Bc010]MED1446184.1 Trifolitoxin immunity domain protein [Bacillus pacificus]
MLSKKQIGYVLVLIGFFTLIVTTLFFQDYEYIRYIKAGL